MRQLQTCSKRVVGGSFPRWLDFALALALAGLAVLAPPASAQSFRVQCPTQTNLHRNDDSPAPSAYTGPKKITGTNGQSFVSNGGGIKCQQVSGGDGFVTMGDGHPVYLFGFGPLSGMADIWKGLPGTEYASTFMQSNVDDAGNINPDIAIGAPVPDTTVFNGAVGLVPDTTGNDVAYNANTGLDGHVDARLIMDVGVMNASQPAPLMAIDEDDEFFLTLTNVGMIMRPDLFEQHTIHFHGYPNASAFYDGVPDASVATNIGASMTYYYLAPDAGTYFWHCHISPPEHLQMGMVGQLYVRPRQNRVPAGTSLYSALQSQQLDNRTKCGTDILCSTPLPADQGILPGASAATVAAAGVMYAYNDGDGSTRYNVEYPIQIHGFDPNFHFVGMTFNPESFVDMKDKYFMLNGRSYPDTVTEGSLQTQSTDGTLHASQPLPSVVNIPVGGRALLRISDLDVTEYQTLASLGIPMTVVGLNARLLRDTAGNNMAYQTNSITLAGGESLDVILDASDTASYPSGSKFFLYTPNLDHLSNDAENFGGLMTEVNVCDTVDPLTKTCGMNP